MSIIVLLVIGLVVGLLARAVLPGKQDIPVWLTVLIGVGGLLIGGAILNSTSLLLRIVVGVAIAAVILLVVDRLGAGRRSHAH